MRFIVIREVHLQHIFAISFEQWVSVSRLPYVNCTFEVICRWWWRGDHSFLNNLTGCFDFRLFTTPRASCILDCYNKFFTKMWVNSTQCEETQDKAAHRMCAPCCSFVWNSKYFVRVNWMLHICVAAIAVCIPVVNLLSLLDDLKRQYHTVKCRFLWSPY